MWGDSYHTPKPEEVFGADVLSVCSGSLLGSFSALLDSYSLRFSELSKVNRLALFSKVFPGLAKGIVTGTGP